MITSYTLDCGCVFNRKPQPGALCAFEVGPVCSSHGNPLSSASVPDKSLPNPKPFLMARQAPNGPVTHCVNPGSLSELLTDGDPLEHTQPIYPNLRNLRDLNNDLEGVLDRVSELQEQIADMEARLPKVER